MTEVCPRCGSEIAECGYAPCGAIRPGALAAALLQSMDEATVRAMVDRMMGVKFWDASIHGITVGHRINRRELAHAALLAALNAKEVPDGSA